MSKSATLSLGTDNIGKLLFNYSVPAIIAMTSSSLYHIIDSAFVGHGVGGAAISGMAHHDMKVSEYLSLKPSSADCQSLPAQDRALKKQEAQTASMLIQTIQKEWQPL